MTTAVLLAWRNLTRNRGRFLVTIGGVALALSLSLALDAIYAGVANQLTAYINGAGADVWVAQAGVRNLHMVASSMPAGTTDRVRSVPGVVTVTPILEATDTIAAGDERAIAYVIGLPAHPASGGPWAIVEGATVPGPGEVIVDRGFARKAGVGLGDKVTVLGRELRIVGLSQGTASLLNSVAFISFDDFLAARGGAPIVSYILVRVAPGASPEVVASQIEQRVPGTTAQSRAAFAGEERRLVTDMSADVISIMNVVGIVVGLAVVALTVYVATLTRRREYGAIKALGARNRFLYGVVVAQGFVSVALGFIVAIGFTELLAIVVPAFGLNLELAITVASLTKVGLFAVAIGALAAVLPVRGIAGLDPAVVFRRGASL